MKLKSRNIVLGTAALALVAFQAPALASGDRDAGHSSTLSSSYGSGSYGFQATGAGTATQAGTHAFSTNNRVNSQGFSTSRGSAPDFNTTRDWR
ncbi:MAG: hypothetical protein AAGF81_05550 [Pseudomonadota bacterium]